MICTNILYSHGYIVRYAQGRFEPPIDTVSQLTQTMAMNRDGMMRMQFMRPIVTNDAQVGHCYYIKAKCHVSLL